MNARGSRRLLLTRALGRMCVCALLLLFSVERVLAQVQLDTWTTENGLPQNSVNDIIQTRDGYLWLATFGGLVRFDGVRFVVFDRSIEGIGSQRIRALLEHSDGTLWAATDDGIVITYRDGMFATVGAAEGLPNGVAMKIEESVDHDVWITWVDVATQDGVITKHFGSGFDIYRRGDLPSNVGIQVGRYQGQARPLVEPGRERFALFTEGSGEHVRGEQGAAPRRNRRRPVG